MKGYIINSNQTYDDDKIFFYPKINDCINHCTESDIITEVDVTGNINITADGQYFTDQINEIRQIDHNEELYLARIENINDRLDNNYGYYNVGHCNSGYCNSGQWNSGEYIRNNNPCDGSLLIKDPADLLAKPDNLNIFARILKK